jgi:hypothetical protein
MVMLECSEMDDDKDHKVNYIMIDPTFGSWHFFFIFNSITYQTILKFNFNQL